jgi:uncharacterized protein (TIGR02996 family)
MTPRDTFHQAVLAFPQNDETRLHFADWLDESVNPLGEFIRVQCRLARGRESRQCLFELATRERELLGEFEMPWAGAIAPLVDYWVFRRGFIEEIALSAEAFVAHAERLFRLAPIQQVHINGIGNALPALASCPFLQRVRFLDLSENRLGDVGARLLAQSPFLAGVEGLNATHCGIGDPGLLALASSPHVAQLRELYLDFNSITDSGAGALATSASLENLGSLYIAFNPITRRGQQTLFQRFGYRARVGACFQPRVRLTPPSPVGVD